MKSSKPSWLKVPLAGGPRYRQVRQAVSSCGLSTVCEAAKCPNIGECWNSGTATFMILGDTCTRGCSFCAVTRGNPSGLLDITEPTRLKDAVSAMNLDYVVITSVTRDDLDDGGAGVFSNCIRALRTLPKAPLVEVLTPDYHGDSLQIVLDAAPSVFAHNIETVERLSPSFRHPRFTYRRSLSCLEAAATAGNRVVTKSSIMLGAGETSEEVLQSMRDLRNVGAQILVLGQYLAPSASHAPVSAFIEPAEFTRLAQRGMEMGFEFVAAGPLVRTSYKAAEAFVQHRLAVSHD